MHIIYNYRVQYIIIIQFLSSIHFPYPPYDTHSTSTLSINLIEWPMIFEAVIPDLVDDLGCVNVVFDAWSCHHGQCGTATHAVLQLLGYPPLVLGEELAREATFA